MILQALGTWGTNQYVGINVRELLLLKQMREKMSKTSTKTAREAVLPRQQEAFLPKFQEVPFPEPQKALLPKFQEVLPPEPQKVVLPKLQEVLQPEPQETLPKLQENHQPEPQEVSLPVQQEVPLPLQELHLPELQEGSLSKPQEVALSKQPEGLPKLEVPLLEPQEVPLPVPHEVPLPVPQELHLPQLQKSLSKSQEVPLPEPQNASQPKLPESPLVRLSKRNVQPVAHGSVDLEPTIDLNCTGPCARSFDETMEKLVGEDGEQHHDADMKDINIFLQTVFQNLSNEKQEFRKLSSEIPEFQNLSSANAESTKQPNKKFELRLMVPDTANGTATNANKSAAIQESDEVAYGNYFHEEFKERIVPRTSEELNKYNIRLNSDEFDA
ncbi:hypothetical protein V9T40_000452 [Parthenolecanium corni]|uniref:Uncharacterized protein n=1 Tax=Parthenolecanium corni TaxID=536013 RepID=A0AAN9Y1R2_9HEMI